MIHLNIIERASEANNGSSPDGYRIGATIDKNTSGRVILMKNITTDYEQWKDKSVLGYSTFYNNQEMMPITV